MAALKGKSAPGDRLLSARFRGSIAPIELGRGEGTAVDDEALNLAGALHERFAEHRRAAVLGRTLARVARASPIDFARNDPAFGRSREGCRIVGGSSRGGDRDQGGKEENPTKHGY